MKCHWVETKLSSWQETMRPGQQVPHKWGTGNKVKKDCVGEGQLSQLARRSTITSSLTY
jgi:hypothetical protein